MSKRELEDLRDEDEMDQDDSDDDAAEGKQPKQPRGPRPSSTKAMRAKCFDCCGDMIDGRVDCQIVKCPLYYWQPYRRLTPDLSWQEEGTHLRKNRQELGLTRSTRKKDSGEEGNDA